MLAGVALLLAAQAAAEPPAPPAEGKPAVKAADDSSAQRPSTDREILICAPKPNGYRIDPDVLAARRAKKQALAGRPKPPSKMPDTSCKVVGPAGCIEAPGINLLAAAATAAEMADRLAKGQEIGSMFVTDRQPTDYELYKEAKAEREAREAEKAAKAKAKAAQQSAPAGN